VPTQPEGVVDDTAMHPALHQTIQPRHFYRRPVASQAGVRPSGILERCLATPHLPPCPRSAHLFLGLPTLPNELIEQLLRHHVAAEVEVLANFTEHPVNNVLLDSVNVRSVGVFVRTPPAISDTLLDGTAQYRISTDIHSTLHGTLSLRHSHSSSKLRKLL
jgi:hypothetical protein